MKAFEQSRLHGLLAWYHIKKWLFPKAKIPIPYIKKIPEHHE